ncbi:hypothetical protein AB8O64_19775 [Streptomyces sp. QH1-20]|uniref:hypothetical protein n=1 Tax=Streptomyces sp. QH1-20 TaxID=3240934 RepID=UPI003515ED22
MPESQGDSTPTPTHAPPPAPAGDGNPGGTPPAPDPAAEQLLADAEQRATDASQQRDQLQAALDAVNKALNPDGADGEQDPAKLAAAVADRDKQLDQVAAELRTAQVELAAYKAAGEQGARADRLLNSRSFLAAVAALDPGDAAFAESLKSAITAAVDADPDLYRAGPDAPPRAGAEFNGAPAGDRRPANLHDAIAARLGG